MVRWLVVLIAVISLGLRIWWPRSTAEIYRPGQQVRITAVVRGESIKVYQKTYLVVEGIAIPVPAKLRLEYGDQVVALGTLEDKVTEIRGARYRLINEDFRLISSRDLGLKWLTSYRWRWGEKLARWLPADEASLAAGILLGGDWGMSQQLKVNFRRSGLTHILAASGYNVSVVAGWTMILFTLWLHRRWAILLGILSIILYVLLAGATAAVVRAGIMATAAWTGKLLGREGDGLWLLGWAAWGMLMVNPAYLSDIGWQLSVAATAGILWLRPAGDWWTTLAAQATTVPLILHHFGNLSVVAPVANVLLLWLIGPIMQVVAVGLVVGPVNWLAWPLLKLMTLAVTFLGSLSWASWEVGRMSWLWVGVYYLLLLILWRWRNIWWRRSF